MVSYENNRRQALLEELSKPSKAKPEGSFWVYLIHRRIGHKVIYKPEFFSRDLEKTITEFLSHKFQGREQGFVLERRAAVELDGKWFIINMNYMLSSAEGVVAARQT